MKISPGIVPAFGVTQISKISFLASDHNPVMEINFLIITLFVLFVTT